MYEEVFSKLLDKLKTVNSYQYYYCSKYDNPMNSLNNMHFNCSDSMEDDMDDQQLVDYYNLINKWICCCDDESARMVLEAERERVFNLMVERFL